MREAFDSSIQNSKKKIKLFYSIGNNDVYPHNKLGTKPNSRKARRLYEKLYSYLSGKSGFHQSVGYTPSSWIDPSQKSIFLRGGYYASDVENTPYRVISLNTMYFYAENKKAGGCRSLKSSGLAQLGWLRSELQLTKSLGKKAIIIGHIHPHRDLYRKSCFKEYRRTVSKFSNIISAQFFGHVNHDAWLFIEPLKTKIVSNITSDHLVDTNWEKRVDFGDQWWLYENLIDEDLDLLTSDDPYFTTYQISNQSKVNNDSLGINSKNYNNLSKNQGTDNFISNVIESYEKIIKSKIDISKLTVATISHSIIPRYHSGLKVLQYLKSDPYRKKYHIKDSIQDIISKFQSFFKVSSSNSIIKSGNVGTLMDYDVYWLNLTSAHNDAKQEIKDKQSHDKINKISPKYAKNNILKKNDATNIYQEYNIFNAHQHTGKAYIPKFEKLYNARTLWGLHNLTVPEYIKWAKKLVKNKSGEVKLYYQTSTLGREVENLL
ncbi:hypothetical protein BB561_005558 [Smittium simulii]|uniref:Calcineurin-like phosphoesterase domain-containing protein n=1 Tax=Smittium simulii TaxID=133385 RepID=A0A2T9Y9S9_9FUNG|nr:hypothetical protein BB561_005558 [Smittium simulii]